MDKAVITITPNRHYSSSFRNGQEFTSVDLSGHNYGGCSPCDTQEEIEKSILNYTDWSRREGQSVEIIDKRIKQETLF